MREAAPPASTTQARLLLLVVVLAWGAMWPVNKALLNYMPPIWSVALRTIISMLSLFAIPLFVPGLALPHRRALPVLVSMVVLHMVAFTILTQLALRLVPAGRSAVLAYTSVLWAPLGAALVLGETLSRRRMLGLGLGILGLLTIFNPMTFDWSDRAAISGNAALLLAAMLLAARRVHPPAPVGGGTAFPVGAGAGAGGRGVVGSGRRRGGGPAGGALEHRGGAAVGVCRHPGHRTGLLGGRGQLLTIARLHHLARPAWHPRRQHRARYGPPRRTADRATAAGAGAFDRGHLDWRLGPAVRRGSRQQGTQKPSRARLSRGGAPGSTRPAPRRRRRTRRW